MARRLVCSLILLALLVTGSAVADPYSRKQAIDAKIARLQSQIAAARARESSLAAEISSVTAQIRRLEGQVGDVTSRLVVLEHDLALHRERLAKLTELFRLQTKQYEFLRDQYAAALERLNRHVIAIYQEQELGTLDVLLSATSFSELIDRLDYVRDIGAQDVSIADAVGDAKVAMKKARERTKATRAKVASATRVIAQRTAEVRSIRDRLLAEQNQLAVARSSKRAAIVDARELERHAGEEAAALAQVSSQLAAQIQAAQGARVAASPAVAPAAVPSSSGLIWPVSGPVTSGFGMRWGRMHEGIDIGAPYGAAVRAAASGIVIYSSWMGGYGNLIVIDHGGGLSTAYAHLSSYAASSGQRVGQGQTVGYIGCTGHCFGPHLHFEVRVNGSPVDPLGYL